MLETLIKKLHSKPYGYGVVIDQDFVDAYWADPNRDPSMAPYLKVGDIFADMVHQDCVTIIPKDEFDRNFEFAVYSNKLHPFTPFRKKHLFLK